MKATLILTITLFTVSIMCYGIVDGKRHQRAKHHHHHDHKLHKINRFHESAADSQLHLSAVISTTQNTLNDADVRAMLDKLLYAGGNSNERRAQQNPRLVRRELSTDEVTSTASSFDSSSEVAECEMSYVHRITDHCRYPGMDKACFKEDLAETTTSANPSKTFTQIVTAKSMARSCCKDGRKCSTQEFEKLCCRTPACLSRCYGSDFYTQRKKIGLNSGKYDVAADGTGEDAATRNKFHSKDRRGSVTYRFLDILARPNPSRPQRKSFEESEDA